MNNINIFIANASGSLDDHIDDIQSAFTESSNDAIKDLNLHNVDVLVVDAPYSTIPELGVGGFTPSPHIIYINLDSSHDALGKEEIELSLLHEFHHAARWRKPGYGERFEEALITEGLACLYEKEKRGKTPIYSQVNITEALEKFNEAELENSDYNHYELFIGGNKETPRWFGYTYGYEAARKTAEKLNKTASQLVNEPVETFQESLKALVSDSR